MPQLGENQLIVNLFSSYLLTIYSPYCCCKHVKGEIYFNYKLFPIVYIINEYLIY